MNPSSNLETAELAQAHVPVVPAATHDHLHKEVSLADEKHAHHPVSTSASDTDREVDEPTEEELATLLRVSGKIPWQSYTIAFVELCERFSYYGTTVVFTNFIQRPLPLGSSTGSAPGETGRPGALGMGQRASTGLTTFNQFWSYLTPLLGAYIADEYLGRFKTVQCAIGVALVGHIILIVSALPPVIAHGERALGAFAVGILIMGVGTGMFKPNISPMLAEQYKEKKMRVITGKNGERQIMDPALTISRIFLYFYVMINMGSIIGQVTMVYAEKYVGFWLSFLLPTLMFTLCPMVLVLCKGKYEQAPPAGSVLSNAVKLWKLAMKGRWSANPVTLVKNTKDPEFWEKVKPSRLGPNKPAWMTFDDAWVDQVQRGLKACTVFLWMPLYWVTYNQMNNNLVSQAATMDLAGIPNDLLNNLNPLSIIILIPIMDFFIYPALRKAGIKFTPVKRIATGFMFGALAMVVACLIQYYIYKKNPCGSHANKCLDEQKLFSPINVWVQTPAYVLIGISEIFANVTSLEYAFTKAPTNMRSLVTAVNLLMSAFGNAITYALIGLAEDPLLIWNYGAVAVVAFIGGILFWTAHNHLDAREDELNRLKETTYLGKHPENRTADEELAADRGTTAAPAI